MVHSMGAALAAVLGLGSMTVPVGAQGPGPGPIRLPEPSGPYAVGVMQQRMADTARMDPLSRDLPGNRILDVTIWYPAFDGGAPAQYFRDLQELESALGAEYAAALRGIETNSSWGAPPMRPPERLPLVIFSHDIGGLPQHHTILAEELASQGYVVAAINHSYGSALTLDRRGRPFPIHPMWLETLGLSEQAESLRWTQVLEWVADILLVHAQLRQDHQSVESPLSGRLDLSQVFLAGHGFGAAAALHAAQLDRRVRAVIGIDPVIEMGHMPLAGEVPVLLLVADSAARDIDGQAEKLRLRASSIRESNRYADQRRDSLLARAPENSAGFLVVGARRETLTDGPFVLAPNETMRETALELSEGIRALVVTFLAAQSGQARHREVAGIADRLVWLRRIGLPKNP